ncbi:MAG: protein TolR [Gammaproteobacteria bacterium]|nr:protein TolR [Gammaproteobacteria bacterium]
MASPMQKRKLMGEINVVPYIDVMLVLLIIFMVTAPLLTQGVKVELPKAGAEAIPDTSDVPPLIVSVDAEGNLYINVGDNEDAPQTAAAIVDRTRIMLEANPTVQVLVKADRAVPYGNVVGAMVLLQQGGADSVGFVTDPLDTYPVPE